MADYGPDIDRVENRHNDLPVYLKLRERTDLSPAFLCVSWRTRYSTAPTQNRRFYYTEADGYWTIPVSIALDMLEEAEDRGMLDEENDDAQTRHGAADNDIIDSRRYLVAGRRRLFYSIADDTIEDWGREPIFFVSEVPDGTWRKIMIVDSSRESCTFRSTTTDLDYNQLTRRPELTPPWIMDNAMQDASAAMMKQFLQVLRGI